MNRVNNPLVPRPPPQIATVNAQTVSSSQNRDITRPVNRFASPEYIQQPNHVDDKQSQMEQSLKRSVTLVIWYKPDCDPVRFTHEVSTFPLFQLTQFPSLITDLELTSESYLDAYNITSGHWEQHMVTTVRTVESEQRLLYKLRKTLLSGLADDECQGLSEELGLQSRRDRHTSKSPTFLSTSTSQLKRPLSADTQASATKRFFISESYPPHAMYIPSIEYMVPAQNVPYGTSLASLSIASPSQVRSGDAVETDTPTAFHGSPSIQSPGISQTPLFNPNAPSLLTSPAPRTLFPQLSHPPSKRWPNDYTVSEIASGFRAMDAMSAQSSAITQRMAFERVFNCRYVKSTVCRHRAVYRKADSGVRTFFEGMGCNEKAGWGEFVRKVEGRVMTAGKSKGGGDEEGGLQVDLPYVIHQNTSSPPDARADSGPNVASMGQPHIDHPPDPRLPGEAGTTFPLSLHEESAAD